MKNEDNPIECKYSLPLIEDNEGIFEIKNPGLTKREYFAGLAMQGLLASNNGQTTKYLVKKAIESADELLNQLENK